MKAADLKSVGKNLPGCVKVSGRNVHRRRETFFTHLRRAFGALERGDFSVRRSLQNRMAPSGDLPNHASIGR